jgi:hypothetical protein
MQEPQELVNIGACIGRQQAFSLVRTGCTLAQAQCLKQIRESGAYEKLGLNWENFCDEQLGISRAYADLLIRQLDTYGPAYFRLSEVARVGPETFQQLAGKVTMDSIEVEGQTLALTPENGPRIRAAIQKLRNPDSKRDKSARRAAQWQGRLDRLIGEMDRKSREAVSEDRAATREMIRRAMASLDQLARDLEVQEPAA